jgi:hypothetical protein
MKTTAHDDDESRSAMSGLGCHRGCRLCALATTNAARDEPVDGAVVVCVGHDVVILVRAESRELIVAPTNHIATLGTVPDPKIGELLATLRRIATAVQSGEGKLSVEPIKELAGSEGHLRLRIAPEPSKGEPSPFADVEALARRLTDVLA